MPKLPDKVRGLKSKVINELIDFAESLQPLRSSTISHNWTKRGIQHEVGRSDAYAEDLWAFGHTLYPPKVRFEEGRFIIQGDNTYTIAAAEYNLPAGPALNDFCFPTVSFVIATKVASIKLLTAFPTMTASEVSVPLIRLKALGTTPIWTLDEPGAILHRGNILFATSLVFG